MNFAMTTLDKVGNGRLFKDRPAGSWYTKMTATTAKVRDDGAWTVAVFAADAVVYVEKGPRQ
jgi:hypothetical protein